MGVQMDLVAKLCHPTPSLSAPIQEPSIVTASLSGPAPHGPCLEVPAPVLSLLGAHLPDVSPPGSPLIWAGLANFPVHAPPKRRANQGPQPGTASAVSLGLPGSRRNRPLAPE